ncbi:anti-sigma factor [Paraburkholderia susongensis]|uniref:Anti-sigma-K factor RskA n=1 Tax=Paraburkholderia susongensis TaxID=1515439 RepID=A0A1X7M4N6_9BURK|nr:anti-sigma factor [Paraburkholderia susongensis]SMG60349.1 Anti-sigma-K factor RskA [Paraburkholderia susongensis]
MNTPINDPDDLRCAEYALGLLDAAERGAIEEAMRHDPDLAANVARWQNRLMPLNEDIAEFPASPQVWARIQSELGFARSAPHPPRVGLWENLRLWRVIGIGASIVAAALAIVSIVPLGRPPVTAPGGHDYMVASIVREDGASGWTATVDVQRARMVVVPANDTPVATDRSTELWLIAPGARPVSLGVIAADQPTIVSLPQAQLPLLKVQAILAVSLEPRGGSPTGQPSGPVLAKGVVGGT